MVVTFKVQRGHTAMPSMAGFLVLGDHVKGLMEVQTDDISSVSLVH